MHIRTLATAEDFFRYDAWVKGHPQGSLWQSWEWKRYQEALGREVRVYVAGLGTPEHSSASALVVIDRTMGGFCTWDIPRGPLAAMGCERSALGSFLERIVEDARKEKCIALYLSSPHPLTAPVRGPASASTRHRDEPLRAEWHSLKLIASPRHEQPEATRIIDLTKSEEEILAQMHPKGRYNIHVSQKNGVRVEQSTNVEAFYGLLQQTAGRDEFRILPLKAYQAFLDRLPGSFLLMAYGPPPPNPLPRRPGEGEFPSPPQGGGVRGGGSKPIAGLLGVTWGQTGVYYYGASDYAHRALMAPYALQWEAMLLCKAKGCTRYDLLGIAPPRGEGAPPQHHPWAGVSAFKEKFGGTIVTYPLEKQIILRTWLWKMLQWKRRMVG